MALFNSVSVLGTSLSKGIILDKESNKYKISDNSAIDLFNKETNVPVKNCSRFGCTSTKALSLIDSVLKNNIQDELILIELGGNDCDFNWDIVAENPLSHDLQPNVPLDKFVNNICDIFERIRNFGKQLAIVTLPPIDSEKYFDWISKGDKDRANKILSFLGDKNYIYRHHELYANILKQTAIDKNVSIVPVREHFLAIHDYSNYLCDDGIHLNEKGQKIMENVFKTSYTNNINSI